MSTHPKQVHDHRPSRRTVATGAAWTVPVILVAAPVPAMAASAATGGISASCDPVPRQGSFTFEVNGSTSPLIRVILTHSGSGDFSTSVPNLWILESSNATTRSYTVPVSSGAAAGTATVTFQNLDPNSTATVTATISSTSGEPISGPLVASVTKTRGSTSVNYGCSVG